MIGLPPKRGIGWVAPDGMATVQITVVPVPQTTPVPYSNEIEPAAEVAAGKLRIPPHT